MILIAHRGNLSGPSERENEPTYLQEAMDLGFDVEVDVWKNEGGYYLGHDFPHYPISKAFLLHKSVWCHAKNVEALQSLKDDKARHFWHQAPDNSALADWEAKNG